MTCMSCVDAAQELPSVNKLQAPTATFLHALTKSIDMACHAPRAPSPLWRFVVCHRYLQCCDAQTEGAKTARLLETVRGSAGTHAGQLNLKLLHLCAQSRPGDSFLGMGMTIPEDATRIIKMMEAVTIEELGNDEEYADIVEDMRDESNKVSRRVQALAAACWRT